MLGAAYQYPKGLIINEIVKPFGVKKGVYT